MWKNSFNKIGYSFYVEPDEAAACGQQVIIKCFTIMEHIFFSYRMIFGPV